MANGRKHFKILLETDVETDKIMRILDHLDVYWDSTSNIKRKEMLRHLFTELKLPELTVSGLLRNRHDSDYIYWYYKF